MLRKCVWFNANLIFSVVIQQKYNFALNTAGSHIKEFKAMLSAAEEDGCVVPQVYHKFKVMTEEKDATYLTEEEQDFLYKMDFMNHYIVYESK